MSTLAAAADLPSDEEADGDFVPSTRPTKKRKLAKGKGKSKARPAHGSGDDSDSASSSSSSDGEEGDGEDISEEAKRLKAEAEAIEAEERKRKAAEAFAAFKDEPIAPEDAWPTSGGLVRMIPVIRERKFAGETVEMTILLPENHPEAIAFLAKTSASGPLVDAAGNTNQSGSGDPIVKRGAANANAATGASTTQNAATSTAPPPPLASVPAAKPPAEAPVKRKPRQSLEQLSAGLTSGKKMSTLEKSQMDWKSHVASSSNVADELESNRRSGGFLEKRDFLERVGDRRNETLESKRKSGR